MSNYDANSKLFTSDDAQHLLDEVNASTAVNNELVQMTSPANNQYYNMLYNNLVGDYAEDAQPPRELKSEDFLKKAPEPPAAPSADTEPPAVPSLLTRSPFVEKLWLMMNDEKNSRDIRWSEDGKSFKIVNRELFMKNTLPYFFKLSNFSSFVRQLNMYGFHKVQDVQGTVSATDEVWQFENQYFQRGKKELLDRISRNRSRKGAKDKAADELDVNLVVKELNRIKTNQGMIADDLRRVRKDNNLLWQEIFLSREKYNKQNETLSTILRFIASVFQSSGNPRELGFDGSSNNALMTALFEATKKHAGNGNADFSSLAKQDFGSKPNNTGKPRLMLMPGTSSEDSMPTEQELIDQLAAHDSKFDGDVVKQEPQVSEYFTPLGESSSSPALTTPALSTPDFDGDLGSLEGLINENQQLVNNIADIFSKYMPSYSEPAAGPAGGDFDVDQFLSEKHSVPSTPTPAKAPAEEEDKEQKKRIFEVDGNESPSSKKVKV